MRLPSYLVQSSTGVYHFRYMVPKRWRERLGRRVIKRSLGVRDPLTAQAIALALAARYARAFRAEGAMSKSPEELLAQMKGKLSKFEIDQKADGTLSIRTNGTPEDNAAALQMVSAMKGGGGATTPAAAAQAAFVAPSVNMMLREAVEKWLDFIKPDAKGKTYAVKRLAVVGFLNWKKNVPISDVTSLDCTDYAAFLRADLEKNTTTNRMIYLAGFFDWAIRARVYTKDNPARGILSYTQKEKKLGAKKRGWQPFSAAQVKAIFDPAKYSAMREQHNRWAVLIGVHTGARVNEVAQLALIDFVTDAGLPCFRITAAGDGQSLKTNASERVIPIHPALIDLGLMDRVEALRKAGETRLFPTLNGSQNGYGGAVSKSFSRYLKNLGVKATNAGRVGFHSFRDTVITTLKHAGVSGELRREYTGHELNGNDDHEIAYGERHKSAVLMEGVCQKLDWGLDIPALKALLSTTN